MRILFFALTLTLASVGCAPNEGGALTIDSFSPLTVDATTGACTVVADPPTFQSFGFLNLANADAPNVAAYYIQINFKNAVVGGTALTLSNGQQLEAAGRDGVAIDNLHITYAVKKGNAAKRQLPVSDDIPQATALVTNGKSYLGANIVGARGSAAMLNEVPVSTTPSAEDSVIFFVGIDAEGKLVGNGNRVSSGVREFPITVFNTPTCANGYRNVYLVCPFPGQDNSPGPRCISP